MANILYRGLDITERCGEITVLGIKDFVPQHIFECGQCFRWTRTDDNCYKGIAGGKCISVKASFGGNAAVHGGTMRPCDPSSVTFTNTNTEEFVKFWYDYFDLSTDYGAIKTAAADDEIMREAVEFGGGIRLLRQDFWEMLISFIVSANNNIPRISSSIRRISSIWGEAIANTGEYSFPTPQCLAQAEISELRSTGVGFRDRYIESTARRIASGIDGGADRLSAQLSELPREQAEKLMMTFDGVGQKVADCVLLFSGLRTDVFPKDVWVFRVMDTLYPLPFDPAKGHSAKSIDIAAFSRFGRLMGYAQQYLFYYARGNAIGK